MKLFCLPCGAAGGGDDSVEHNRVHDLAGGGDGETFPHGPQRNLIDHRRVEFLYLFDRAGQFADFAACLDVAEVPDGGDNVFGRQPVLDDQLAGIGPVGRLEFAGKPAGILGKRERLAEELLHRLGRALPEAALKLINFGVVLAELHQ